MLKTIEYRDLAGEVRQERFALGIQRALLDDGTILVVEDDGAVVVLSVCWHDGEFTIAGRRILAEGR